MKKGTGRNFAIDCLYTVGIFPQKFDYESPKHAETKEKFEESSTSKNATAVVLQMTYEMPHVVEDEKTKKKKEIEEKLKLKPSQKTDKKKTKKEKKKKKEKQEIEWKRKKAIVVLRLEPSEENESSPKGLWSQMYEIDSEKEIVSVYSEENIWVKKFFFLNVIYFHINFPSAQCIRSPCHFS
jgi:hypothetical protein